MAVAGLWRPRLSGADPAPPSYDQVRLPELSNLATKMRVPTVVTNDVLFHEPGRRVLQDVVTAIRHNVTINELGFRRELHADRYLNHPKK